MTTESLLAPPLSPRVAFPEDTGLPELPLLFDDEWVWQLYHSHFGAPESGPSRFRIRQFSYNPRRYAVLTCAAEWPEDEFRPEDWFVIQMERGKPARIFEYRQDPALPGLAAAGSPESAAGLLNKYVLSLPPRRVVVDTVRYRPGSRAVLRYKVGKVRFYGRAIRPPKVSLLAGAAELSERSGWTLPRLAGVWPEGGVVWLAEIPGQNLRKFIRQGNRPDPGPIFDGLERLWAAPGPSGSGHAFNLHSAYRRAKRVLRQAVGDESESRRLLRRITGTLDPFVDSWQPVTLAHNDLYDDQMVVAPDGKLALVDFEETGPGDPLLDVGNFLAHLRWSAHFGGEPEGTSSDAYYRLLRSAALERFGWEERALDSREAVCLFRICTNPVRHLSTDWHCRLTRGLRLVDDVLDGELR